MFYPPVLAYVAYLMAKHRSVTLFTAANPAILASGFIGESKFDILQGLSGASESVARSSLLDRKLSTVDKMLPSSASWSIRSSPSRSSSSQTMDSEALVSLASDQLKPWRPAFVNRPSIRSSRSTSTVSEFGVFYYRYPSEPHGRIFSVTEKKFPAVVGDGRRTAGAADSAR